MARVAAMAGQSGWGLPGRESHLCLSDIPDTELEPILPDWEATLTHSEATRTPWEATGTRREAIRTHVLIRKSLICRLLSIMDLVLARFF
jgi:hypothetical protein